MTIEVQTIHTTRLVLLPLLVEHAEELAAVLSDPALRTFIGGEPADPPALHARYERLVAGSPDPDVSYRRPRRLAAGAPVIEHDGEIRWRLTTPAAQRRID